MFFDAHNHLQDAWLAPHRARILVDLAQVPLGRSVVNGTCQQDWPVVTQLAAEHSFILPSFGLHPWYVGDSTPAWRDELVRTLDRRQRAGGAVAIGEVGLDRWILDRARPDDSRLTGLRRASLDEQIEAFTWQLGLAADKNLPVSIHCIDAWGALLDVLRRSPRPTRGFLLHAYGGSAELARDFGALGAFFSFNGYFLGERQAAKREVFAGLPADRLLVETDAPAMPPPERFRAYSLPGLADGNPINHPANIEKIYEGLAAVRQISLATLAAAVADNFRRLFGEPDRENWRPESGTRDGDLRSPARESRDRRERPG